MNNRNANSQLGSVIDQLGQNRNSEQLKSDRAELDKKIVDLLMKQQSTISGLQKSVAEGAESETTTRKVGNVNAGFYADVVGGSKQRLSKGDGAARVGAKIYAVILQDIEHRKLRNELEHNFEKEHFDNETKRQKELIDTITGKGKPKVPKPGRDEKGRFVKKTPEEAPAGKAPSPKAPAGKAPAPAPAPAVKPAPTPAPAAKPAPAPAPAAKPAPKVEAKPTTAVKAPGVKVPQAAAPTVTKTSGITKALPTAVKAVAVSAAAAGAFTSTESFANTMLPYAKQASADLGGKIPPKALLGQWALESSWGKKPSGDYNYFGIKADKNWKGDKKLVTTSETFTASQAKAWVVGMPGREIVSQSGNNYKVKDWFRSYSSIQEAVNDKVDFFKKNPRYQKSGLFEAKTSEEYFNALKKSGYATDKDYVSSNLKMVESVDKRLSGDKLNKDSTENKDLKNKSGQTTIISNNSTTNNIVGGKSTPQVLTTATPSEKPPILGN
jgi:flagellar protein FlgJ